MRERGKISPSAKTLPSITWMSAGAGPMATQNFGARPGMSASTASIAATRASLQGGTAMTLRRPSRAGSASARPASTRAAAASGAVTSVSPRSWMLPRPVSSIAPLPHPAATTASVRSIAALRRPPNGLTRIRRPSPESIGA
jgi:hypothetical protein